MSKRKIHKKGTPTNKQFNYLQAEVKRLKGLLKYVKDESQLPPIKMGGLCGNTQRKS